MEARAIASASAGSAAATSPASPVAEAISSGARTSRSRVSHTTAATPSTWSRRRKRSLASPTTSPMSTLRPLMCAGITTFNALRESVARPGDVVAILGVGGLGHLGIQFAAKMGFEVVAIARGKDKEPLAKELGAHHYIDSKASDVAEELNKLGGAQVVLATVTVPDAMTATLGGLKARGPTRRRRSRRRADAGAGGGVDLQVEQPSRATRRERRRIPKTRFASRR